MLFMISLALQYTKNIQCLCRERGIPIDIAQKEALANDLVNVIARVQEQAKLPSIDYQAHIQEMTPTHWVIRHQPKESGAQHAITLSDQP